MKGQSQSAPSANPLGGSSTGPNPFGSNATGNLVAAGGMGGAQSNQSDSFGGGAIGSNQGMTGISNPGSPAGLANPSSPGGNPLQSSVTSNFGSAGTTPNPLQSSVTGNFGSPANGVSGSGSTMPQMASELPMTAPASSTSPPAAPAYNPFDSRNPNFDPFTGQVKAPPPTMNAGAAPNAAGGSSNEWGSVTNTVAPFGTIQQSVASGGPIQRDLNTSNVPALVGGDALAGTMRQAQDAAYQNATGYLDPQWQNQQTALQNQLANQGVMQNSEAWNKAMDDFARQKQFAYQQAQSNAVNQGLAAQGQLFNQGLQANQNAFGQDLSSGQFTNAAQGQQFGQNLAQQQAANAAQAQGYGENLQNAQFANAAQNQLATQGLQNRQIASQLEGTRAMANAQMSAASTSANASMQNLQAQLAAQHEQNQFNDSMALRNQGLNELLLQQQNPLNVANALNQGSGIQQPNFTSTPGANVSNTDIMQAIQNAYGGQLNSYNAATGNANSSNAAMASIIAAMLCDRRLKKNIRKIGVLPNGCALYEFEYLWGEKAVGPMADEIERVNPEAVFTLRTGHKVVNFARL